MALTFKSFLETKDIFGFDSVKPEEEEKEPDDLPIQSFNSNHLMDLLAKTKLPGLTRPFDSIIIWGNDVGAIKIKLTPNLAISIERKTNDLSGNSLWIIKKLFKIKIREFAGKEDFVASELEKEVMSLAKEPIDVPIKNYKKIEDLTKRIAQQVIAANKYFSFQRIKKINDNNYNILFNITNFGLGKIVRRFKGGPTPAGLVDISYNEQKGIIKCFLTTIGIEGESESWQLDHPYFVGEFAPTQSEKDISKIMYNALHNI